MFLQRDPFSVLYLGFNLDHPVMSEPLIREAVARAVNRGALVQNHFLEAPVPPTSSPRPRWASIPMRRCASP